MHSRPVLASIALESAGRGWRRNLHDVDRAIEAWNTSGLGSCGLEYVADGREIRRADGSIDHEASWSRKGRGTTAIDLGRSVVKGPFRRIDMLSVKTDNLTSSGGFPSKIEVSTQKAETQQKLLGAIANGASIPTVIWASSGSNEEPNLDGFALFIDIAAMVRSHGIVDAFDENGFSKGQAPAVWRRYSSRRNCGATSSANKRALRLTGRPCEPGKWEDRAQLDFPMVDELHRKWSSPWYVHYPEIFANISKRHLREQGLSWVPCHIRDLAKFVESQDWQKMGY